MFVAACGKSTLGLAYGLSVAEALLAPAMPSTTARAGGIFMPIINSLSLASDSKPSARLEERNWGCDRRHSGFVVFQLLLAPRVQALLHARVVLALYSFEQSQPGVHFSPWLASCATAGKYLWLA